MNGPQTLALVVERALEVGASACYLLMRQGIGMIVYVVGNRIEKVSTISPKVFADCNAVLLPYLHLQGAPNAVFQSGVMGFQSHRGPLQVMVRSFQHVEPVLCLQLTQTQLTPISFGEVHLSGPATLAIRQFLSTSQRMLFVTADNPATNQSVFMQCMYGALGLFSRMPVLYSGAPLSIGIKDIQMIAEITGAIKQSPQWPSAVILDNNFNTTSAAMLSAAPQPGKVVIAVPAAATLQHTLPYNIQAMHMFGDNPVFLPSVPMYVEAMPRLCYRCRQPVVLRESDYIWLQKKLSGEVESSYTVPDPNQTANSEEQTALPAITHLQDLGVNSLLDLIAKDPGMVDRSAEDKRKKQTEIATKQVWQTGRLPTCPVCRGSGYDGYVLATGFAELGAADVNDPAKLTSDADRLKKRFWVDVFDKVETGLVGIQHLAKLAVQADQQTTEAPPAAQAALNHETPSADDSPFRPAAPEPR